MVLKFVCEKDPQLAQHYERKFGLAFAKEWALFRDAPLIDKEGCKARWKLAMLREARLQEHYDFMADGEGMGELIYELDRVTPKLLIPKVVALP